jgi:hypothetical protein
MHAGCYTSNYSVIKTPAWCEVRGVYNDAAKSIADSLKLILSILCIIVDCKEGGEQLMSGDGKGLGEEISEILLTRYKLLILVQAILVLSVSGEGLAPIVSAYSRLILVDGTVL